ncbi:hypothetical protein ATY36_13725 [Vibrio cidicii]|uniref:hypothetical protein n=1 Tax=Vibrio cidicii TaxID=1763883 RepID=UPI00078003E3|nr:hypothetical protein [Vibrio cidicii]KYN82241.1 hypothetical protein ATY36_13725 [Vibrio cidicii]
MRLSHRRKVARKRGIPQSQWAARQRQLSMASERKKRFGCAARVTNPEDYRSLTLDEIWDMASEPLEVYSRIEAQQAAFKNLSNAAKSFGECVARHVKKLTTLFPLKKNEKSAL